MRAAGRGLVVLAALNALVTAASCPPAPKPGDPLRGLTAEELDRFNRGKEVFERAFTPETGLGPLFNADAGLRKGKLAGRDIAHERQIEPLAPKSVA